MRYLNRAGIHHETCSSWLCLPYDETATPLHSNRATADTGMVASCSMDRTVKLWDLTTLGLQKTLLGHVKVRPSMERARAIFRSVAWCYVHVFRV